ncbi:hypothetical protein BDZ45DRAFT_698615 [Acephala macrosclerotiorum]|nr:hypothetical protein BDZ45DRAFT_698615 [Acephala macrosclerotiorum]
MRFDKAKAGLALALGIAFTTKALPFLENNKIQLSTTSLIASSQTTSYAQLLNTTVPTKEKHVKRASTPPQTGGSDTNAGAPFALQTPGDLDSTDVDNFQNFVQATFPDTENWIFYSGDDYTDVQTNAFMAAVSHTPGYNPTSVGQVFPVPQVEKELVREMTQGNEWKPWAFISYRYAMAAKGTAHVFLPEGRDLLHPYQTETLGATRISNWERYELPFLTRDGGAVNRILRYDSGGNLEIATIVWQRGDPEIGGQLGVPWDFVTPPWQGIPDAAPGAEPDLTGSSPSLWNLLCCMGSCCF